MKNPILLMSLFTLVGSFPLQAKVSIKDAEIFSEKTKDPESITVSPDGQTVYWIARKSQKTKLEPIDGWYSDSVKIEEKRIHRPLLNIYTMVSYAGEDRVFIDHEYGKFGALVRTLYNKFVKKVDEPAGYKSCIDIYNMKEERVEKKLCAKELGLEYQELIEHARLSPDGNWMAFYLKGSKNPAGIYLYNLNTEKLVSLGEHNDKHPTWSADGKKILFHFQKGGNTIDDGNNDSEESWIGWYDVNLSASELLTLTRTLLDNPENKEAYVYQKHPTLVPGTDYVIYHGQEKADGGKKLFIRSLKEGSKVQEISFKYGEDCKIKSTKHPAIGFEDKYLYFAGKVECNDVKSEAKLFRVELQSILKSLQKEK